MKNTVAIQDIEDMRLQEGIDDVELRVEIRDLKAGDFVKLTFMSSATSFETLRVRITSIRGSAFRGKLVKGPTSSSLSELAAGAPVIFTTAHIHSVWKKNESDEE